MRHTKYVFIFVLFLISLSYLNCKKDSESSKTRSQLLTEQDWKLVVLRYKLNNFDWSDEYLKMNDCRKDNILSFKSNFAYILDEGVLKCDPLESQIFRQGTWNFLA